MTGLTVGKFDPPHRGHALLIDVACAHVDRLLVLVFDYAGQSVAAEQRAAWLREIHPDVEVRVIPDRAELDPSDAAGQARHIAEFLEGKPFDVLFSSEAYGEALARDLGMRHYSVDRDRRCVPVTGTMVRRAPLDNLEWLEPCVRAHYARRVCVVGSESTGKTSLCERLARRYDTSWVPEYGREYTFVKLQQRGEARWISDEFYHIAREQQRREDEAARGANRVLFCDTDSLATRIWHERYMEIEAPRWPLPPSRIDLYLLPFPDVPFVADGVRDSEHMRYWMYERFVEELTRVEARFVVLQGTFEERDAAAIAAVDGLLSEQTLPLLP